jgi:hypothetical protein
MRADAGRDARFELTVMGSLTGNAAATDYEAVGVDRLIVSPWRRSAEAANGLREFAAAHLAGSRPATS